MDINERNLLIDFKLKKHFLFIKKNINKVFVLFLNEDQINITVGLGFNRRNATNSEFSEFVIFIFLIFLLLII